MARILADRLVGARVGRSRRERECDRCPMRAGARTAFASPFIRGPGGIAKDFVRRAIVESLPTFEAAAHVATSSRRPTGPSARGVIGMDAERTESSAVAAPFERAKPRRHRVRQLRCVGLRTRGFAGAVPRCPLDRDADCSAAGRAQGGHGPGLGRHVPRGGAGRPDAAQSLRCFCSRGLSEAQARRIKSSRAAIRSRSNWRPRPGAPTPTCTFRTIAIPHVVQRLTEMFLSGLMRTWSSALEADSTVPDNGAVARVDARVALEARGVRRSAQPFVRVSHARRAGVA